MEIEQNITPDSDEDNFEDNINIEKPNNLGNANNSKYDWKGYEKELLSTKFQSLFDYQQQEVANMVKVSYKIEIIQFKLVSVIF